jgi:hypothetical protein
VIVLHKLRRQAEFLKLISPESLGKESPVIAKDIRNDDCHVAEVPRFNPDLHE